MSDRRHLQLVLLRERKNRLQCRHGHLTIDANELTSRYCLECFEGNGKKQYDVDEVTDNIVRYRCRDYEVMIEAKSKSLNLSGFVAGQWIQAPDKWWPFWPPIWPAT